MRLWFLHAVAFLGLGACYASRTPPVILNSTIVAEAELSSSGFAAWWPTQPVCFDADAVNTTLNEQVFLYGIVVDASVNDEFDLLNGVRFVGQGSTQEASIAGQGLGLFGSGLRSVGTVSIKLYCNDSYGLASASNASVTLYLRGKHSCLRHMQQARPRGWRDLAEPCCVGIARSHPP